MQTYKDYTFIKVTESPDLGRLYQSVFHSYVEQLLHDKYLYSYVDYHIETTSFNSGILLFDIEPYNSKVDNLIPIIANKAFAVDFSQKNTTKAISRLIADSQTPFDGASYSELGKALKLLHAAPWQNIDDVGIIDGKQIHKKRQPFYAVGSMVVPVRYTTLKLVLDSTVVNTNRQLLPLVQLLMILFCDNIQHTIDNENGYAWQSDKFTTADNEICKTIRLKVTKKRCSEVNISEILNTGLKVASNIKQSGAIDRLMQQLCNVSYTSTPDLSPNIYGICDDTQIFIGAKGWQQIATKQNCDDILKNATLEVKFGKDKVSAQI